MYGQENRELDGYIDCTANVTVKWNGVEKAFQVLFQTHEKLDDDKINRTISLLEFHCKSLEDVIIYPVLWVQLILISAGCRMVFHMDKQDGNDEVMFHGVYFQIPMLLDTFKKIATTQPDGMKPTREFRHEPLKGLFYKHVADTSISGMARNILNEMNRNNWLMQSFEEKFGPLNGSYDLTEKHTSFIARNVTQVALKKRNNRNDMTGEWIVFEKNDEKLHLLTLASHRESDQRIFDRISWADLLD